MLQRAFLLYADLPLPKFANYVLTHLTSVLPRYLNVRYFCWSCECRAEGEIDGMTVG